MDTDRNSTKKLVFMRKARDFFNKQIEKEKDKLKRELTKEERKDSRKKNRKKARLIATVATSFALGVGSTTGINLLNSGNTVKVEDKSENSVTIDAEEIDKIVKVQSDRPVWVNGLHVGKDELETVRNMNHDLEINTRREIDSLENKPEQVEMYIKTLFVDEYNREEGTNITCKDITINRKKIRGIRMEQIGLKDRWGLVKEEKTEENSFSLFKEGGRLKQGNTMLISILIDSDKEKSIIQLPYVCVEQDGPIKDKYLPGAVRIVNSLPAIDKGLDWIDKEARDGNSKQVFFEAILEHKKSQMNKIATDRMEIDNQEEQGYFVDDER